MIIFIVSYFVVVVWTMLPIVVAILLENFTNAARQLDVEEHHAKLQDEGIDKMEHTLDPMVRMLTYYTTDSDLSHKIHHLYLYLLGDSDVKRGLDYKTMAHGLKRRHWKEGGIHLSVDDFDSFTCNGAYADARGCMSEIDFEAAARLALQHFMGMGPNLRDMETMYVCIACIACMYASLSISLFVCIWQPAQHYM